ncbi:rhomboid family intramembrane serine protease, partial [Limosilactobacillus gastricus]
MIEAFKRTPVTITIIVIQVLVFIAMELNGGSTNTVTLLNFGAEYTPLLVAGQWWRLITSAFVHIGIMHLLLNSIVLYY